MPNRILREGILTSPRIAKLGWAEEVFYRRLHSVVDDFGRYYADHGLLLAACYPRLLKKVSDSDIGKWLRACEEAALVRVYPAQDGERYLELLDFGQQVRAKKSRFPNPPSDCYADAAQEHANAHLDVSVSVSVSEGVDDAPAPTKKAKQTGMPEGFGVSDRVREWARKKGYGRLEEHLEAFVSKAKAKAYTYADWDEGFMGAIRDDWAGLRKADAKAGKQTESVDTTQQLLADMSKGTKPPSDEVRQRLAELRKAA